MKNVGKLTEKKEKVERMMLKVNAIGDNCPIPVIKTKKSNAGSGR